MYIYCYVGVMCVSRNLLREIILPKPWTIYIFKVKHNGVDLCDR